MVKNIEVSNHSCSPSSDPLSVPSLIIVNGVTNSSVKYQVQAKDKITRSLITGYEVIRFGVPMIGEYVHAHRGSRVTISPAVPGAQYRMTVWALGDGRRSATPAVVYVTPGKASKHGNVHILLVYICMWPITLCWVLRDTGTYNYRLQMLPIHYVIYS